MALILGTTKLTSEATRALIAEGPVARAAYFKRLMDGVGGKVLGYYFAESSEFDIVAIIEVPDESRTNIAQSVAIGALGWSSGHAVSMRNFWLTTPEEFEEALKTATGIAAPGKE